MVERETIGAQSTSVVPGQEEALMAEIRQERYRPVDPLEGSKVRKLEG